MVCLVEDRKRKRRRRSTQRHDRSSNVWCCDVTLLGDTWTVRNPKIVNVNVFAINSISLPYILFLSFAQIKFLAFSYLCFEEIGLFHSISSEFHHQSPIKLMMQVRDVDLSNMHFHSLNVRSLCFELRCNKWD